MKLNDYFRKFVGNISLNPTRKHRITNALSNWEKKISEDTELEDKFKDFFPQGSYSTETTVKPKEKDEYDIDAVLLLDINENEEPKDILYWIRDRITSHKEFEKKAKVKDRCVRIDYANDFHVDIVPAIPYGDIIKIPSKKEQAWTETNPAGFTEWCNDINKDADGYYSDIVKMSKHWRDNKVGKDTAPKSILLSTILGHNFKKMPSLAETLTETLEETIDFLEDLTATQNIVINNPSLLQENIARDWDIEKANRFLTKVKKFHTDSVSALNEKNKDTSIQKWQDIFGTTYFPAILGEGKEMAEQIEEGNVNVNSSGHLTSENGQGLKITVSMENIMGKKPSSQPKRLNLGLQELAMQKKFPDFKLYNSDPKNIYWIGYLQPKQGSQKYKVMVKYNLTSKVYILDPEVLPHSPHRYSDNSLCLFHPNDRSYSADMLLSDTIIPWTSEWLYFYELWLEEGVWWGKEAPHSPNAKRR